MAEASNKMMLIHARIAVSVDLEEESISGVVELTLTPPAGADVTSEAESMWDFALHCCDAPDEDGSGLTVESVTVDGVAAQFRVVAPDRSVAPVSHDGAGPAETALRGVAECSEAGALRISAPASCLRRVTVRATCTHGLVVVDGNP